MKLTPQDIAHLKRLKALNLHGEAYEAACAMLKLATLQERLARINSEHERLGHLTLELSGQRRMVYDQMLHQAKAQMSHQDYEAFYMCF